MQNNKWLFVCEGAKTEPNYIRNLIERINAVASSENQIDADIRGLGKNTLSLVGAVDIFFEYIDEEYGKMEVPYGNIGLVFDKDSFGKDQFNSAIHKAQELNMESPLSTVYTAWSNESFELWLNLHFSYIESDIGRDALNDRLTDLLRKGGVLGRKQTYDRYGKNRDHILDDIEMCGGSLQTAMKNATKLAGKYSGENYSDFSPCTMMHKLIDGIMGDAGVELEDLYKML